MKKKLKFLILEDVPTDAELVKRELRKEKIDFSSKHVVTKKDFLRELKGFAPDIIISDYQLPQFNGMEALELVKKLAPSTPFIICTGSMNEETAVECMKAGATDYVIKDHIVRISPAVKSALEKKLLSEEKKRADNALLTAAREWQTTFNAMDNGVVLISPDKKIIRCNNAMATILKRPLKDIVGSTCCELICNKVKDQENCLFNGMLKTQKRETAILKLNNNWFMSTIDPIFDKNNNITGAVQTLSDITERKKAEEELKQNQTFLDSIVENIPNTVFVKDAKELRFKLLNKAGEMLFGYNHENILGKNDYDIFPKEQADFFTENDREVLRTGQLKEIPEELIRTKEGERILHTKKIPISDEKGNPLYILGISEDITERKEAEEALRASEERFALAVQGTNDGIWDWDIKNNTLYWSPHMKELLGYADDEIYASFDTFTSITHPDDREPTQLAIETHFKERVPYHIESRLRTKSGEYRWFYTRGEAVWDEAGNPIRMVGSSTDIAERKLAEEELRKLSIAVEQSPISIVITDINGDIEYLNSKFTDTTGYSYKELLGKALPVLKSEEHPQEFYKKLWETISSGVTWKGEIYSKKKDGTLYWVNATISPIKNEKGTITHYILLKEDITEKKNLEDQLRLSQRMEAIGRFAGGIAHDFNNMMTAVIGFSDYLLSSRKDDDSLVSILKQIKSSGQRAAELTHQLLAFSSRQVMESQIIDLNLIIGDIEQMMKQLIGEDIALKTAFQKKPVIIKADRSQVEQIIMNLAVNSRDAMPGGGKLCIETATAHLDEDDCKDWIDIRPGLYVMLSVTDTGHGINKETQAHIFEPFYTTKEIGKGTGLGLSTVYGIVKQSGGHIHCYSELGKGTTFKIYFPSIVEPGSKNHGKEEEPCTEALIGSETVLIVEDEDIVRDIASSVLKDSGYRVLEASNSDEALAICRGEQAEKIDLLITDVIMPGMRGPELAREVLAISPETTILFISGYPDNAVESIESIESGKNFLQKPFTPKTLLMKIRQILKNTSRRT